MPISGCSTSIASRRLFTIHGSLRCGGRLEQRWGDLEDTECHLAVPKGVRDEAFADIGNFVPIVTDWLAADPCQA